MNCKWSNIDKHWYVCFIDKNIYKLESNNANILLFSGINLIIFVHLSFIELKDSLESRFFSRLPSLYIEIINHLLCVVWRIWCCLILPISIPDGIEATPNATIDKHNGHNSLNIYIFILHNARDLFIKR